MPKFAIFQNRTAQMKKIFILLILLLNVTLCHVYHVFLKTRTPSLAARPHFPFLVNNLY